MIQIKTLDLSALFSPSEFFHNVLSSQRQQPEENELSDSPLSVQPSNESGTIQCITTPCKLPSPQPMPFNTETDKNNIIPIPKNVTQLPDIPQNDSTRPAPCISPCPPGEICIQMYKPVDQIETPVTEPESSKEQEQQNSSTLNSDEYSSNTPPANGREDSADVSNDDSQVAPNATESSESTTS